MSLKIAMVFLYDENNSGFFIAFFLVGLLYFSYAKQSIPTHVILELDHIYNTH